MAADSRKPRPIMLPLQKLFSEAVRSSPMSYQQLAIATGMNRSTISEMVNGRVRGSLSSWQKLLDATGVEIGYKR